MRIYEAFIDGPLEALKHLARAVHDHWSNPPHEEFRPRTAWLLQNGFTHAFKAPDPIPMQRATASLATFFKEVPR